LVEEVIVLSSYGPADLPVSGAFLVIAVRVVAAAIRIAYPAVYRRNDLITSLVSLFLPLPGHFQLPGQKDIYI
jgi:hypothetical protein